MSRGALDVFALEGVVRCLASNNLSFADWYNLRATCRWMRKEWMAHNGRLIASGFLVRILDRFGWKTYPETDSFAMVSTKMAAAKLPFAAVPLAFECTGGCGKVHYMEELIACLYSPYATCARCYVSNTKIKNGVTLVSYAIFLQTGDRPFIGIGAQHQISLVNFISAYACVDHDSVHDFVSETKSISTTQIELRHYTTFAGNASYEYRADCAQYIPKSYFDECVAKDMEAYNLIWAYDDWHAGVIKKRKT